MSVKILIGDCRVRLAELPDNSVDSVVTDPPYELGFMGREWDRSGVANDAGLWREVRRVLKPGGHLVAFSGTRTYHRMAVAIEDAGFEVRDMVAWHYGSGFPKSHDISKAIDKAAGAEREVLDARKKLQSYGANNVYGDGPDKGGIQLITAPATDASREWEGWGTALKPATEPICLARKPLSEKSIAANVLKWGTGALNIDGCRIEGVKPKLSTIDSDKRNNPILQTRSATSTGEMTTEGRWPANLCHDGSDEVVAGFPETTSGEKSAHHVRTTSKTKNVFNHIAAPQGEVFAGDSGSAARFFYCAKADAGERGSKCQVCGQVAAADSDSCPCTRCAACGQTARATADRCGCTDDAGKSRHAPDRLSHPTVKPQDLMRWLARLVTPKGGTVLDPFAGTGSTGVACQAERFAFIGCELSADYAAIAERRLLKDGGLFADVTVSPLPRAESAAA